MQLNELIRYIRQKAFLSQDAFATEIGVTVSTINRWENGKAKPNLTAMKNIKAFCDKYDLPYEQLESEWFKSTRK